MFTSYETLHERREDRGRGCMYSSRGEFVRLTTVRSIRQQDRRDMRIVDKENTTPVTKQPSTYASDRAATGTDTIYCLNQGLSIFFRRRALYYFYFSPQNTGIKCPLELPQFINVLKRNIRYQKSNELLASTRLRTHGLNYKRYFPAAVFYTSLPQFPCQ
jgi:hypothetical protein